MAPAPAWYSNYRSLSDEVQDRKAQFEARCTELGTDPIQVMHEIWLELVARAVKESNWQEGLELGNPRTGELATEAFKNLQPLGGPHLDLDVIISAHNRAVGRLKRQRRSREEIGAFNLATAHLVIPMIGTDLAHRLGANIALALSRVVKSYEESSKSTKAARKLAEHIKTSNEALTDALSSDINLLRPMTGGVRTAGQLLQSLMERPIEELRHPMRIDYINAMHRLTLAGLYPSRSLGRFRRSPIHVGREQVLFPQPSLVPGLMSEFCKQFPPIFPGVSNYDAIKAAALTHYKFVAIHPYRDGNGRAGRLLMNLVLWGAGHPIVYLKADKKGRHRYAYALRRANRGNSEPLACLIAMSLAEIYSQLLRSVNP